MLTIHNATLITPDQHWDDQTVLIDGGRIVEIGLAATVTGSPDGQVIDATGLTLIPGLIDLQFNGAFGHDFTTDPASIWAVAADLPQYGLTSFLPTVITSPLAGVAEAQRVIQTGAPAGWQGARPLGLHLEGPFLNEAKKGAHNPVHLRPPSREAVADWSPEQGVRLVTLAPELPGALPVIETLAGRGVVVSAGHSMANGREALAGFAAGISYGTHLFNAMPTLHHREPGLTGALLTRPDITVGLIPDGIHVHPAMIDLAWRCKGSAGITLVTDAMAALGMPPGHYQIGDQAVTVGPREACLSDGTLAGSIVTPDAALRNLIDFTGCTLQEALPAMTSTPAAVLGLTDRGRIAPGYVADVVLLSPELNVVTTIAEGKVVYSG